MEARARRPPPIAASDPGLAASDPVVAASDPVVAASDPVLASLAGIPAGTPTGTPASTPASSRVEPAAAAAAGDIAPVAPPAPVALPALVRFCIVAVAEDADGYEKWRLVAAYKSLREAVYAYAVRCCKFVAGGRAPEYWLVRTAEPWLLTRSAYEAGPRIKFFQGFAAANDLRPLCDFSALPEFGGGAFIAAFFARLFEQFCDRVLNYAAERRPSACAIVCGARGPSRADFRARLRLAIVREAHSWHIRFEA